MATSTLEEVRAAARQCTRCDLFRNATQTVFGEGPADAKLMLIGEQPGDQEDRSGHVFVGPAGRLLDRALQEAGVDRSRIYITNAVKHFKFEYRGKRRLHQRPDGGEISACRWWYEQERLLVRPSLTLAMGGTAARTMLQRNVTINAARDRPHLLEDGGEGWVTIHPSYLVRIRDKPTGQEAFARFVSDLSNAWDRSTSNK